MKRVSNHRKNIKANKLGEKRVNSTRNAIHNSGAYYRFIFESAQYGILIIHARTGRIDDANSYLLNLLGYSRNEIVRKTAWQLHVDPETARQNYERVSHRRIDRWDNLPLVTANGNILPVEVVCSTYQVGKKKLIQCNIREITELIRTEQSLKNLSNAIDASGDAVFMTDKDGIFTSINPRFTDLYGYMLEEVISKVTPRILKSGVQDPEFYTRFWKTILQKELVSGEVINRTKDGKLVFIEETVNPFLDDHGEIAGFLAIQRNVTERKEAEENVRRKLSQLKALREIDMAIASSFAM